MTHIITPIEDDCVVDEAFLQWLASLPSSDFEVASFDDLEPIEILLIERPLQHKEASP